MAQVQDLDLDVALIMAVDQVPGRAPDRGPQDHQKQDQVQQCHEAHLKQSRKNKSTISSRKEKITKTGSSSQMTRIAQLHVQYQCQH